MQKLLIKCPAKINLFLNVTGVLASGYHLVNLVNQTVSLEDEIGLSFGNGNFATNDSSIPTDEKNSVIKAMKVFLKYVGMEDITFDIELLKRIPLMAGLGGESTDAAGMLLGLNELLGTKLQNSELKKLAMQVGSDVPFLIDGGYKRVSGIGEKVDDIGCNPYSNYLIVKPNISNLTKNMYASLDQATSQYKERAYTGSMYNDFERIADPQIYDIKQFLLQNGAMTAGMTGSGSAVVGVFEKRDDDAYQLVKSIFPETYQVTNSKGISIEKAS